ncbi:MAG: hypothetical protein BWY83_02369 [bacterium ADurb.Bin478]|nr:MAG: hypothetical protein BWY83_02369 [bacterium ADurb.Bin478]
MINAQIDAAEAVAEIQAMPQHFDAAPVKAEQQRAAGKRPGVGLAVIIARHLCIVFIPEILGQAFQCIRNRFDLFEDIAKGADLFTVVLGNADVPDVVMSEKNDNGIRARGHHSAEAAVAQQGAAEKVHRRSFVLNGMQAAAFQADVLQGPQTLKGKQEHDNGQPAPEQLNVGLLGEERALHRKGISLLVWHEDAQGTGVLILLFYNANDLSGQSQ